MQGKVIGKTFKLPCNATVQIQSSDWGWRHQTQRAEDGTLIGDFKTSKTITFTITDPSQRFDDGVSPTDTENKAQNTVSIAVVNEALPRIIRLLTLAYKERKARRLTE